MGRRGDDVDETLYFSYNYKTMFMLLHPRSVCIVGASADPNRLAGRPLERLARHAFPGDIYLVNPAHERIGGYQCYPDVGALPVPVDVAIVVVPAAVVPDVVEACGKRGIPNVIVLSSGFEEEAGNGALVDRLRLAVRRSKVRLVGPNCEGVWSVPAKAALTFGSAAERDAFVAGPVSVISQSGSIGGACMRELQDRHIGCRYFISTGNETDTTALDFCDYLIDEGGSTVIGMFLEGLRDGERLPELAARARERGIVLIALRAGSSKLGQLAITSHTGRMATAAGVYRDIFRQHGILEVATFTELLQAIELACLPLRSADTAQVTTATGRTGAGVIAVSGGCRAVLADSCARMDVPLAEFSAETVRKLGEVLPRFGYASNPTDVTGQILNDPAMFAQVTELVASDPNTDTVLVQYANGAERQLAAHVDLFADLQERTGRPVVASLLGGDDRQLRRRLRERGIVHADDPDEAVRYLSWIYRLRRAGRPEPVDAVGPRPSGPVRKDSWASRAGFLERAGIAMPAWAIVGAGTDPTETVRMGDLRFPLVAKALPEVAEHKTDRSLVMLGIDDADALASAVAKLHETIGEPTPVLLQEMVVGGVEVLLTVRHDVDFGPVLVLGAGGPLTEWLGDICHVQLPAGPDEIRAALQRLRLWDLLQPFRGRGRCDIESLVEAAHRLSTAYLTDLPERWEVEINPLMVFADDRHPLAVDVLCVPPGEDQGGRR